MTPRHVFTVALLTSVFVVGALAVTRYSTNALAGLYGGH